MLPRRGVVEIEALRRYGRVPVGTRAMGWFVLSECAGPYMTHSLEYRIQVEKDPRIVGSHLYFPWTGGIDEPYTRYMFHRGKSVEMHASGLLETAIQSLTHLIEDRSTSKGFQRFRVIRAEWEDTNEEEKG